MTENEAQKCVGKAAGLGLMARIISSPSAAHPGQGVRVWSMGGGGADGICLTVKAFNAALRELKAEADANNEAHRRGVNGGASHE